MIEKTEGLYVESRSRSVAIVVKSPAMERSDDGCTKNCLPNVAKLSCDLAELC